jgi:hypothetical protein
MAHFPCPYLGSNVELTDEREHHIANHHPDPLPEQEREELDDEIIARFNPETDEIENLEVLFFSTRLLRQELFQLPISARLHLYKT